MTYEKQNFKDGEVLKAEHLNHIEEGIRQLSDSINDLKENGVGSTFEPTTEDIPKVFFDEAIPQTKDDVITKFRYISKTQDISGYAEFKAQGNSSMVHPKKNMTVKLYADEGCTEKLKVNFKGWGEQNKFCLKANWVDITHARNVVSARIWRDIVESREGFTNLPEEFRTSPNLGAVDGFPIKVYSQGIYQGRYTWNIPKDAWMTNMDDSLETHCILCSENYVSGCFRATASINGNDWTDEIHDVVPSAIVTRWNEVINFVMTASDEDFVANFEQYFDKESIIDYFIYAYVSTGLDSLGKNQLFFTYDGQKWLASMYDMEGVWGMYYDGKKFVGADYRMQEDYETGVNGTSNLLYDRVEELFVDDIKARYSALRLNVLSHEHLINRFERFTDITPNELVVEDFATTTAEGKFTGIPSQTTNNIQQIRENIVNRLAYVDSKIETLGQPEVYTITQNLTNVVTDCEDTTITEGTALTIILTAEDGYAIQSVGVTMGGVDITNTAYADGIITLSNVTGNIVVNAIGVSAVVGDVTYLRQAYAPSGTAFEDTIESIDFVNGDYIEAKLDLSTCASGNQNIFSFGASTTAYGTNNMQFYYNSSTKALYAYTAVKYSTAHGSNTNTITLSDDVLTIIINKDGIYVNGTKLTPTNYEADFITLLLSLPTISVGCGEGSTHAYATYTYIRYVTNTGAEVTEANILYKMDSATVFDGTNYVDTEVQLAKENSGFTIMFEALNGTNSNNARLFHCIDESAWGGYSIRVNGTAYEHDGYTGGTLANFATEGTVSKVVLTHLEGSNFVSIRGVNADSEEVVTGIVYTWASKENNLLIGCGQSTDGTKKQYWKGTMNSFVIYDGIISGAKISEFFNS